MSETRDHVSVRLDNILLDLHTSPCNPTIFRVDDDLRCINQKLYDPKLLSIGPFHHGKDHLQKMQQHKFKYLKLLMGRREESTVDKYVMAMRSLEEKARKSYAEVVELSQDEFTEILILDGCFIIELIRKYGLDNLRQDGDTIFQYEQVLSQVRHDLILVENQVPLFVLDQLFSMTRTGDPDDDFLYLIQLFIGDMSPWPEEVSQLAAKTSLRSADHLLGLVHRIWCSSFAKMTANRAGFAVADETESTLRNLIAYEHLFIDNHPKYVTDYAFFLYCLINSSKDVEILRRHGILTNYVGDDHTAYQMFNRLGKNILVSADFCYADVYDRVNGYSGRRRNRWMAILRHKYFNSPWAFISFLAASMLLLFTLTQTVFSILSYVNHK